MRGPLLQSPAMSKHLSAAVAALAVLTLAAAAALPAGKAAPKAPAPPASRDILLITIDPLRADARGFAGNRRSPSQSPTPLLDRLAGQGRVFTNTHAHNVVT